MNPFLAILEQLSQQEDLVVWLYCYLRNLLRDRPGMPDVSIPRDYRDRATYLVSCFGAPNSHAAAQKFGDAALAILRNALKIAEVVPNNGDSELLSHLLFLLEGLPTSCPSGVAQILNSMRISEEYKQWPDKKHDCHRDILLALANQIRLKQDALSGWEREIIKEMEDPAYTAAAFSILMEISPQLAVKHLPAALTYLKVADITRVNLLFGLGYRLGDDVALWNQVVWYLKDAGEKEIIVEIEKVLQNLGLPLVAEHLHVTANKPWESRFKALIVDDEPNICDVLQDLLEDKGYNVISANCIKEAQQLLISDTFDIIILDIVMEETNGSEDIDGLAILRQIYEQKLATKVILLTGHASVPSTIAALRLRAFDCITKDISNVWDEIVHSVHKACKELSEDDKSR